MPEKNQIDILIFLKAPIKGQVKTRLSTSIGEDRCLELYRSFVMDVLEKAGKFGKLTLFFSPSGKRKDVEDFVGSQEILIPQTGKDLGEKMADAFEYMFSNGSQSAILIGTDVPDVSDEIFLKACSVMDTHDMVIGPVSDGGYFLIGFNRRIYNRNVFDNIPWSTSEVFNKTLDVIRINCAEVHVLPVWHDVDTADDLCELIKRLESGLTRAPRTFELLKSYEDHFHYHSSSE